MCLAVCLLILLTAISRLVVLMYGDWTHTHTHSHRLRTLLTLIKNLADLPLIRLPRSERERNGAGKRRGGGGATHTKAISARFADILSYKNAMSMFLSLQVYEANLVERFLSSKNRCADVGFFVPGATVTCVFAKNYSLSSLSLSLFQFLSLHC